MCAGSRSSPFSFFASRSAGLSIKSAAWLIDCCGRKWIYKTSLKTKYFRPVPLSPKAYEDLFTSKPTARKNRSRTHPTIQRRNTVLDRLILNLDQMQSCKIRPQGRTRQAESFSCATFTQPTMRTKGSPLATSSISVISRTEARARNRWIGRIRR